MTMLFTITVGLNDKKPVSRVMGFQLEGQALEKIKADAVSDPVLAHMMLKDLIQNSITEEIAEVVGELVGVIPPFEDLTSDDPS